MKRQEKSSVPALYAQFALLHLLLAVSCFTGCTGKSANPVFCHAGYTLLPNSTRCFQAVRKPLTFQDAVNYCRDKSRSFLTSVLNEQDHVYLINQLSHQPYGTIWLGLKANGSTFYWMDGTPYNYTKVRPDDEGTGDCYVLLNDIGQPYWQRRPCNQKHNFTCKRIEVDACLSLPCKNGATCYDRLEDYTCKCELGYAGMQCESEVDDCNPPKCENGGNCTDLINNFTCACDKGYHGMRCQYDINECVAYKPCYRGTNCTNSFGSYQCACSEPRVGQNCTHVRPTDPNTTCPKYVNITEDVNCSCISTEVGEPPVKLQFDSAPGVQGTRLSLFNVRQPQNGTRYVCRQTWDGPSLTTKIFHYTLQVAFGPYSVKVLGPDGALETDGFAEIELYCDVGVVHPRPIFLWTGATCFFGNHQQKCRFRPRVPDHNGAKVTCFAHNPVNPPHRANDTYTIVLNWNGRAHVRNLTLSGRKTQLPACCSDEGAVSLECDAVGIPPLDVQASLISGGSPSQLTPSTKDEVVNRTRYKYPVMDAGSKPCHQSFVYQCVASNRLGDQKALIELVFYDCLAIGKSSSDNSQSDRLLRGSLGLSLALLFAMVGLSAIGQRARVWRKDPSKRKVLLDFIPGPLKKRFKALQMEEEGIPVQEEIYSEADVAKELSAQLDRMMLEASRVLTAVLDVEGGSTRKKAPVAEIKDRISARADIAPRTLLRPDVEINNLSSRYYIPDYSFHLDDSEISEIPISLELEEEELEAEALQEIRNLSDDSEFGSLGECNSESVTTTKTLAKNESLSKTDSVSDTEMTLESESRTELPEEKSSESELSVRAFSSGSPCDR